MPKVKISEYSATANSNTDVASINIDEGCAPSGINNAIRAVMGHLKDFQQGTYGDPFNGPVNGTLGATTAATANVTTLTTSSTVTHNGGTANGVAYLNGSKVLTTGSALVFDGTNLGVGVTPSANAGVSTLNIANYNRTFSALTMGSNANSAGYVGYNMGNTSTSNTWKYISADTGSALYFAGNEMRFMQFASGSAGATTSGTQAMTLDASSNLGVGTTSPATKLHISTDGTYDPLRLQSTQSGYERSWTIGPNVGVNGFFVIRDSTAGANRLAIDTSGNLLVGTTGLGTIGSSSGFQITSSGAIYSASTGDSVFSRRSTDGTVITFRRDTTSVGSIDVTTTATSYVTSSDYRLKNTIAPMTGALAKVAALKPVTYKWNADGSNGEGFIAHELAEVVPQCVTGEKDAVDADGNPKYQGIDTSFLVATLTAAIQELKAEFDAYKASHP